MGAGRSEMREGGGRAEAVAADARLSSLSLQSNNNIGAAGTASLAKALIAGALSNLTKLFLVSRHASSRSPACTTVALLNLRM